MAAKKAPVAAKVKAAPAPKQVAAKPRVTVSKVGMGVKVRRLLMRESLVEN